MKTYMILTLVLACCTSCVSRKDVGFSPQPIKFESIPLDRSQEKLPPLHAAVSSRSTNTVESLLAKGEDVNFTFPPYGLTPLLLACRNNDIAMVSLLLEHGADANVKLGYDNTSPLHIAVENRSISIVKVLVNNGANINRAVGRTHETPLHLAVLQRNKPMVELLLDLGADVMQKDHNRRTPLDRASGTGQKVLEDLMRNSPTFHPEPPKKKDKDTETEPLIVELI